MELNLKGNKGLRLLYMYEQLVKDGILYKAALAEQFGISEKTFTRDIEALKDYLAEFHSDKGEVGIIYDAKKNGYVLYGMEHERMNYKEILAVCKVLLESRAFTKSELDSILDKLCRQTLQDNRKLIDKMVRNESTFYIPLQHGKELIPIIWDLSNYIHSKLLTHITYTRLDGKSKEHTVQPLAIMFSEFYFYLIAYLPDKQLNFPTTFRIDRIQEAAPTKTTFAIPYSDKFSESEWRKRVQFMYSGELRRVKFEFTGPNTEAILDRLPTAQEISHADGVHTFVAESYGDGIFMWLRSQGDSVKIISGGKENGGSN